MPQRSRGKLAFVLLLLLLLQFYLRPRLWDSRAAPDFIMLGLLIYATRARPGAAAVAGFLTGLMMDSLGPSRFGAAALANTMVGYLAAWGRAVFFADNLLVHAGFIWAGVWLRDLIVLLASGAGGRALLWQLAVWSPLQALTTAVAGVLILVIFRDWLAIRLEA
jgi:rod shape-determining protein MreD